MRASLRPGEDQVALRGAGESLWSFGAGDVRGVPIASLWGFRIFQTHPMSRLFAFSPWLDMRGKGRSIPQ